eukprot:XP_020407746.1 40S ribosomal protein S4 [Zea mays]
MLKYSLDENDKEDGVNIEVIGDNKIASPSMPPTSFKLYKVRSVQFGQKGIPYLNTYDGHTIRYPDPLIKANDTIKIDLETNKIMDFIKFYSRLSRVLFARGGVLFHASFTCCLRVVRA